MNWANGALCAYDRSIKTCIQGPFKHTHQPINAPTRRHIDLPTSPEPKGAGVQSFIGYLISLPHNLVATFMHVHIMFASHAHTHTRTHLPASNPTSLVLLNNNENICILCSTKLNQQLAWLWQPFGSFTPRCKRRPFVCTNVARDIQSPCCLAPFSHFLWGAGQWCVDAWQHALATALT